MLLFEIVVCRSIPAGQDNRLHKVGILMLSANILCDDPPRLHDAVGSRRKIVLYCFVKRLKIVAGHMGKHVMFSVEIHVPIPELYKWVANVKGARCQPKIIDHAIFFVKATMVQPDMLCAVAEPKQPAVNEWTK